MNKLIRNIPDDVAEKLKKQAKAKGLTLEAYMRLILIEEAKKQADMDKRQGEKNGK
jgi:plasmid stability protein